MKLPNFLKKVKPAEVFVLVVFVLYLIFPVTTPSMMSPYIESPLGMLLLFCLIVAMFLYCNPVLGVLFIFVAYTLLHAVMFIGGSESLLYNLRSYFWILLALDIITNLLTREKLLSDITKAFPVLKSSSDSDDTDDETGYRLIVPSANPEEELPNSNSKESRANFKASVFIILV